MFKNSSMKAIPLVASISAALLFGSVAQAQSSTYGAPSSSGSSAQGALPAGTTKPEDRIVNPAPTAGTSGSGMSGSGSSGAGMSGSGSSGAGMSGAGSSGSGMSGSGMSGSGSSGAGMSGSSGSSMSGAGSSGSGMSGSGMSGMSRSGMSSGSGMPMAELGMIAGTTKPQDNIANPAPTAGVANSMDMRNKASAWR